jgi:hypothetical protein
VFRVTIVGDVLSVIPLDYGWFTRATTQRSAGGLAVVSDDRRNVVIASSTAELRRWLTQAPAAAFSLPVTFARKK